ncbi:MAG: GAF domain-containing protein [Thermoplasmatota archaeon]
MVLTEQQAETVKSECRKIIGGEGSAESRLLEVCKLLRDRVDHYDWVGFYFVGDDRELVLGPYIGASTEHTRIGFGEGICGQAAESGEPFLVQDVSRENNYLSCSPQVMSEIVLPIHRGGELVGELDIDSHRLEPFTEMDTRLLQDICDLVSPLLRSVPAEGYGPSV